MDEEMNNVMASILAFKKKCKDENIDEDNMETLLLGLLESAGIEFNR